MQRLHCFSTSKHLLDAPRSSVLGPSFQLLQDLLQIYKPPTPKEAVMKALPSARVYSHPKKLAQQTHPVSSSSFCFKHVLVVLGAVVLWTKCRLAINMLLVHEVRWSIKITWEAWNCRITHHIHSLDILSFLTLPDLKKRGKVFSSCFFVLLSPCAMSNMFTHITCGHHSLCQLLLCFCLCTGPWWHLSRVLGCRPDICCYLPTAKAPKTRPWYVTSSGSNDHSSLEKTRLKLIPKLKG